MRILFLSDFDWSPPERGGRVTIAFKKGQVIFARKTCAVEAIAAGAAELLTKGVDYHGNQC